MPYLIISSVSVLHCTPGLSIVTVSNFKHRHKLHHTKVFGPLSDDAREALCLLQINLGAKKMKLSESETSLRL